LQQKSKRRVALDEAVPRGTLQDRINGHVSQQEAHEPSVLHWELSIKFVVIDSRSRLEIICSPRGLWLSSTIIVFSFSSCMPSGPFPKRTLFRALLFVGGLLLEFCLLGSSISISDLGLAMMML
jgi:hypothetical protein